MYTYVTYVCYTHICASTTNESCLCVYNSIKPPLSAWCWPLLTSAPGSLLFFKGAESQPWSFSMPQIHQRKGAGSRNRSDKMHEIVGEEKIYSCNFRRNQQFASARSRLKELCTITTLRKKDQWLMILTFNSQCWINNWWLTVNDQLSIIANWYLIDTQLILMISNDP